MKSKSPFKLFSLSAREVDQRGNYANPRLGRYRPTTFENPDLSGIKSSKAEPNKTDSSGTIATHGLGGGEYKGFGGGMKEINLPETPDVNTNLTNPNDFSSFTGSEVPDLRSQSKKVSGGNLPTYAEAYKNDIDGVRTEKGYKNFNSYLEDMKSIKKGDNRDVEREAARTKAMNGSPNKLIGDTMNINPGAVPPNQAQNDLGAQPIISADGSQPNARAIDIAAIANPYATPGADFNPQSKMKAESIFGSPMQRQGLMNLGTPLHDAGHGEKQSHSHPSKTTTKMKPDGEYPGAKYVKGDLVDQDDLIDKTKLDVHIATQVQSDKKGTFIKEKSDDGPGSDIETSKGFGKKIRLGSMGRSSYTSNMKDQLDPNDFLFKNTPKK